jgi:hypothetical protein
MFAMKWVLTKIVPKSGLLNVAADMRETSMFLSKRTPARGHGGKLLWTVGLGGRSAFRRAGCASYGVGQKCRGDISTGCVSFWRLDSSVFLTTVGRAAQQSRIKQRKGGSDLGSPNECYSELDFERASSCVSSLVYHSL